MSKKSILNDIMNLKYDLIDAHSHRINSLTSLTSFQIYSLSQLEIESLSPPPSSENKQFCAGIHPWWLSHLKADQLEHLKKNVSLLGEMDDVWAIGETGLDRLHKKCFSLQLKLFKWHILLSENLYKPLIVHNVRAFSDILHILKWQRPKVSWIFHDYRGNPILTKQILSLHPECYFSIGSAILKSSHVKKNVLEIPLAHQLIETDDEGELLTIYQEISALLDISFNDLKHQVIKNFCRCFSHKGPETLKN